MVEFYLKLVLYKHVNEYKIDSGHEMKHLNIEIRGHK